MHLCLQNLRRVRSSPLTLLDVCVVPSSVKDVSRTVDQQAALVIHAMFAKDPDKIIRDVKQGMERRLLEAMRD